MCISAAHGYALPIRLIVATPHITTARQRATLARRSRRYGDSPEGATCGHSALHQAKPRQNGRRRIRYGKIMSTYAYDLRLSRFHSDILLYMPYQPLQGPYASGLYKYLHELPFGEPLSSKPPTPSTSTAPPRTLAVAGTTRSTVAEAWRRRRSWSGP